MSEANSNFNWSTEFDTVNNTMTHTFSERVKVVLNWNDNSYSVIVDGEVKNKSSINGLSIDRYEKRLLVVAETAKSLE